MKDESLKKIEDEFVAFLSVERNLAGNTLNAYRQDLKKFFSFILLNRVSFKYIKGRDLTDFMIFLKKKGLSSASIARNLSSVRSLYRYLASNGQVSPAILNFFESPKIERKIPEIINKQDIDRVLGSRTAEKESVHIRNMAVVGLLATTGLRISELSTLKKEDINFKENWIKVTGKGNRERIVFFPEYIKPLLENLISKGGVFLFGSRNNRPLTRQSLWKIVKQAGKKAASGTNLKPHMLRHTFATQLLESGMDIRIIQELLGHKSISTTKIYTQVSKNQLKSIYRKFHPRA
ncbi:MAG: tyrosine-type recombinase/integrase [Candidatus Omnitrophica bacterium]|nr:tyrosine-type recombinase/integrase [Candidatus Omnitrophota bacterium]MCM8827797.1 tyrosine-type recombinase/integrase [Candidatus Omnitrophota bacterium]